MTLKNLYISHAFNTWDERMFEFSSYILLLDIFRDNLFFPSIYGLCITLVTIIFNKYVGRLVDNSNRLKFIRITVIVQKFSILVCYLNLFFYFNTYISLPLIIFSSSLSKLATLGNTMAIEKDWIPIICANDESWDLSMVNSTIRRIDLISKMLAPIFISLFDDKVINILVVLGFSLVGLLMETIYNGKIYYNYDVLKRPKNASTTAETNFSTGSTKTVNVWSKCIKHESFLPGLSLATLYLTVLSFSGPMIGFLRWVGYSDLHISTIRAVCVVSGISATYIQPLYSKKVGVVRAGLHFIWLQTISLGLVVYTFYIPFSNGSISCMLAGVIISRIGLWGFDLSDTQILQELVKSNEVGMIYAFQNTLINIFDLLQYTLTMIWADPKDFIIPANISWLMVFISAVIFTVYSVKTRGHLLHINWKFF